MTQPCISVGIADYELRTGLDVPDSQEPTVQRWLDDSAMLVCLYLGDCADEVAAAYGDVLIGLICSHVYVIASAPAPGVQSESIASTNVTYATGTAAVSMPAFGLTENEQRILDQLIMVCCPGGAPRGSGVVGQIGINWGGPDDATWAANVDVWVTS